MSEIDDVIIDAGGAYFDIRSGAPHPIGNGEDATDIIQSALDQHPRVFIPAGVYTISRPLRIHSSGRTVLGAGALTVLRAAEGLDQVLLASSFDASVLFDIHVEGFCVDGGADPLHVQGINLVNLRRLIVRNVEGRSLESFVGIAVVEQFEVSGFRSRTSLDTVTVSRSSHGTITNGVIDDAHEGLDFFDVEDVAVTGVSVASRAPGTHQGHYQTGFDFSCSRRIAVTGCVFAGDFQWGIHIKQEGENRGGPAPVGPAVEDIVISGCVVADFREVGIYLAMGHPPFELPRRVRVEGCTIASDKKGAMGIRTVLNPQMRAEALVIADCTVMADAHAVRMENYSGVQIRGCTLRSTDATAPFPSDRAALFVQGGREPVAQTLITVADVTVTDCRISAAAGHCVYMNQVQDPVVQGCSVSGGAVGVWINNCRRPVVRQNVVHDTAGDGIRVRWSADPDVDVTRYLETVNLLIGAVVDGNLVRNWGRTVPESRGIQLAFAGISGVYSQASVSANRLLVDREGTTDGEITVNGQIAIAFDKGSLGAIEWTQVDNNLVFGAAQGILAADLGPTCTQHNNMVKPFLR